MLIIIINYLAITIGILLLYQMVKVLFKPNNKQIKIFLLVNIIFTGTVSNLESPLKLILILLISILSVKFFLKLSILASILSTGLWYIVIIMGDLLYYLIMIKGLHYTVIQVQTSPLLRILANILALSLVYIFIMIIKFFKQFKFDEKTMAAPQNYALGFYIITVFGLLYAEYIFLGKKYNEIDYKNILTVNVIVIIILIVVSLIFAFTVMRFMIEKKENRDLKIYIDTIDELSLELRRFKHDYLNILQGIGGFIQLGEFNELKTYFADIIGQSKILNENNFFHIQKIRNPAIFGLISAKSSKAETCGIKIFLKVTGIIDKLPIKETELCEVLGILLDNAIEAASETMEKELLLEISDIGNEVKFVIKNSIVNLPNLSLIGKKGYSTKKGMRGLGLWIVHKVLEKYQNIKLNTKVENNIFIQNIRIEKNT